MLLKPAIVTYVSHTHIHRKREKSCIPNTFVATTKWTKYRNKIIRKLLKCFDQNCFFLKLGSLWGVQTPQEYIFWVPSVQCFRKHSVLAVDCVYSSYVKYVKHLSLINLNITAFIVSNAGPSKYNLQDFFFPSQSSELLLCNIIVLSGLKRKFSKDDSCSVSL